MFIKSLSVSKFKKIDTAAITLSDINVLVGANSSGKSSILQAIHFSVCAAIASRQQSQQTFSTELLMYNITPDFTVLKNGEPYKNSRSPGNQSVLSLFGHDDLADRQLEYNITISKGRNHGNMSCERTGDYTGFGSVITDEKNLFSIYVPGLAGISQKEELKSPAIVRRGVASGDANLYLRNVIYYLNKDNRLVNLNSMLQVVFPDIEIEVDFKEDKDTYLTVNFKENVSGKNYPIELAGTGLLQTLQIFAYIVYFKPKLLLLDEPDSHLHPDNQYILTDSLSLISESDKSETQVILSTHSKHIIDSLYGEANFIWMKDGNVQNQGMNLDKISMFLDLGALNDLDRVTEGVVENIFLTEDRDKKYFKALLQHNGFDMQRTAVYSYKTCTNVQGAIVSADLLKEISPNCKVIIHRDRDFMTDDEVDIVKEEIQRGGAIPFITEGSDIESYFTKIEHLSHITGSSVQDIQTWISDIATQNHVVIQHDFQSKRDVIKYNLYKGRLEECPRPIILFGNQIPTSVNNIKGKYLLKKIRGGMQEKLGRQYDLTQMSPHLLINELRSIIETD
ncbi:MULTISPECIES: AAA family ATPase [Klebsiella pneumoniae complex]|uniref:AAA family ATPase n=1 Tax=Klebsiella pneumoniae complex TaxID=3390273 RepID=UPI001299A3C0|nr:ATP-binding protein [Klebsiella variicola]QGG21656.1 AAA family ATPase [Klebsiella variicola]HBR1871071.1 AAA family ATPase [Klebsiella variicola]HBZ1384430.1 DUF2813 domain-containing protein [Klebsiella pneumoniae]